MDKIKALLRSSAGATAIEYGLIAAVVSVAALTAMQGLGAQISTTFEETAAALAGTSSQ